MLDEAVQCEPVSELAVLMIGKRDLVDARGWLIKAVGGPELLIERY
jgi:hypothetical protein